MTDHGTIARPYARALFDVASESGALDAWSQALNAAAEVVAHEDAAHWLAGPQSTPAQQAEFVGGIASGAPGADALGSPQGKGLLSLLAENGRLAALPEIARRFDELKAQAENKLKVIFVSATEVDDALAQRVAEALEKKLGRKVELELQIDASLLGGAIIRAEDLVIDGSVRTRLQRLSEALVG